MSRLPDPEVLVVGGGVAGLFCAYHLRRRGLDVTVVESGPVGGPQSCSAGNTGFVGTHGSAPLDQAALRVPDRPDPAAARWLRHFRAAGTAESAAAAFDVLVGLKKRGLAVLRELRGTGALGTTLAEPGMLLAYRTAEGLAAARESVPRAVASGVPLRELGPGELAALEPGVPFAAAGALVNPEGAVVHAPAFVFALARLLVRHGVRVRPGTEVLGLDVERGRVRQVRTSRGDLRPGRVVLAAGAWTADWAARLGVRLELQPVRGHSVTLRAPAGSPGRPVLLGEETVALTPLGATMRAAGGLQLAGFDRAVDGAEVDRLLRAVRAHLPGLERTETVAVWSGLRPCTPDSVPLLGPLPAVRDVTVACGYGHVGMGLAPAAGELAARAVTGEAAEAELAPFRPDRFAAGGRP